MQDRAAAQWWSQALRQYHTLRNTARAKGISVSYLPAITEKQIEVFSASLQQQIQEELLKAHRRSQVPNKKPHQCELILFVDDSGACDELTQAAKAAGICGLPQMLPEHAVMIIGPRQVRVGVNIRNCKHPKKQALRVLWSAQEETSLQNSLKRLSKYLGIAKKKLQDMVDSGQLEIQQCGTRLHFTCDGITVVMDERMT